MRLQQIAFAASLAGAPALAQSTSNPQVDLAAVKKDLRALVVAQEVYFTDHNRYSPDLGVLKMQLSDSVSIRFVETSTNAWAASGSIKGKPGASCVVMVGRVSAPPKTQQGNVAKAEGGVLCDGE